MEQQDKTMDSIAILLSLSQAESTIKKRKKKAKMRKMQTVKIDLLSKTEGLLMEQQGKTMDRTSQFHHYYGCNRPRRQIRRQ